jgi:hypothetical protein
MAEVSHLRKESLSRTRAATLAAEDTDGIVHFKDYNDDMTRVVVEFSDPIPLEADYLVKHQDFNISTRTLRDDSLKVYGYSHK